MSKDSTNDKKAQVKKIERIYLKNNYTSSARFMGSRHCEAGWMSRDSKGAIKRISKDEYIVLSSGEIRKFEHNIDKQAEYIRHSMRNLERLIKTNFDTIENKNNAVFMTLTYAENMQDYKRLYRDFNKFMLSLKYAYKDHHFEYIAVAEPQARGAWHMHVLIKSDQETLFLPHEKVDKLWGRGKNGKGSTHTVRLKSDDVGCYYTAYFKSLEVIADEDGETVTDDEGKKYKKGARLKFYPKGMRFYRCSRGIKKPVVQKMLYGDVIKEFGQPYRVETYNIVKTDEHGNEQVIKTIQHEWFKKPSSQVEFDGTEASEKKPVQKYDAMRPINDRLARKNAKLKPST
jgi:hypothetical protein